VGTAYLTVTFSKSGLELIDLVSDSIFTPTKSYSGNDLNHFLRQDDVSKQAEKKPSRTGIYYHRDFSLRYFFRGAIQNVWINLEFPQLCSV
jgi:hypothetical protein